jgi:thiosulfate dehydrogenase (quinone) large subunit
MEAKTCGCCWDPKCMAPALIRWALGVMFLVGGISKIMMGRGFVTGYLVPAFEKTFLPGGLVAAYGYALPYVEAVIGVLLVLGLFRHFALLLTGVTLVSLAFGQILLQQHGTVANIFLYVFMTAAALWMSDHDRWTLGCRGACGTRDEAGTT